VARSPEVVAFGGATDHLDAPSRRLTPGFLPAERRRDGDRADRARDAVV